MLTTKSDARGAAQLTLQLAEIALAASLIAQSTALAGPAALALRAIGTAVMGFGLVTMGHCAQHECIHNTAFATRRLNTVVSWIVSMPRLTNPAWERMLHKDHHTYTNDPARDPEIMAGVPANSMPGSFEAYITKLLRIGGGKYRLGAWSARLAVLINCAAGRIVGYSGFDPVPEAKAASFRTSLQRSCRLQLVIYAGVLAAVAASGSWTTAWRYWLLPFLVGEPMHAFFHVADHLNCAHDYKNGAENTRTTPAPAFVRFNLWNMNYHAEHHLYPSIPFHQLPKAHSLLEGHFVHASPSALDMHRQLLTRWMPYFRERLEQGVDKVEASWEPCSE
jgi:fatty acid desaturase